jgi:hypothetical protein
MRSLLLAVAIVLSGGPAVARDAGESPPPRIYRWIDENGIAHYTTDPERIPKSLRRRYGLPAEPLRSEPLDARAPAPAPAPAPAAASGPDAWAAQEKGETPEPPRAVAAPSPSPAGGSEWNEGSATDVAAGPPAGGGARDRLAQIELRIAELSASIAADEDKLSGWVGDPAAGDVITLADQPEFREIAQRLPERIQELEALQRERDALRTAVP